MLLLNIVIIINFVTSEIWVNNLSIQIKSHCISSTQQTFFQSTDIYSTSSFGVFFIFYYAWYSLLLFIFSIYQNNRYPFLRALIGSRNVRYPRLLVDFEAEVKMT